MATPWMLKRLGLLLRRGDILKRTVTTNTGALVSQPIRHYRLVLFRVAAIAIPFTYVGYWAGGQFAEFLEEHEFYIPDEDEDD